MNRKNANTTWVIENSISSHEIFGEKEKNKYSGCSTDSKEKVAVH